MGTVWTQFRTTRGGQVTAILSDNCAAHEMPEEMDLQLWTSALSHSLDARKIAEMTADSDWLKIKAEHVSRHDKWIRWECSHLACRLHFRLIPCSANPTCFRLQLLSFLTVYPQQIEHRARDQEMLQHIRRARAEHMLDSHHNRAYVPQYDPSELKEWTSHMDPHSWAGIHQTLLLIKKEVAQMVPGRKRLQLLTAIQHMLRDVLALRRSPVRTPVSYTHLTLPTICSV
eukprot:1548210-Rhodomonas_salina.1